MPTILTKEYGPFTGTVWLVIIAGGIGLGLVMRRFTGSQGGDNEPAEPPPEFGVENVGPPFASGGGTQFNQGQIVSDVIEAINTQGAAASTTDPTVVSGDTLTQQIKGLKAERERLRQSRDAKQAAIKETDSDRRKRDLRGDIDQISDRITAITAEIESLQAQRSFVKG
jgi:uncharacterized small protein (DUF1192 family)